MKRAVELANENTVAEGEPFCAVLVKEGEIVAEGINELYKVCDVSVHAEMQAIRKRQLETQTVDLSGCIMYASGEPCPMCLGAMYLSGIKKGYYCLSIEDAADRGLMLSKQIYEEFKKPRADRTLVMKPMPLDQTEAGPIRQWQEKQAKK